jgi:hypothetical protein
MDWTGFGGQPGRGNYVAVMAYNIGRTEVKVESVGFIYGWKAGRRWLMVNPARGSNRGPQLLEPSQKIIREFKASIR